MGAIALKIHGLTRSIEFDRPRKNYRLLCDVLTLNEKVMGEMV